MPIRTQHVDPELFYQFGGVKVFHTYKDGDADNPTQDYWFTVNEDDMDESFHFDIRDKAQMGDAAKWYNAQADISFPGGAQWLQKQAIRLAVAADAPIVEMACKADGGFDGVCSLCRNEKVSWFPQNTYSPVFDVCLLCATDKHVDKMRSTMNLIHWPEERGWLPREEDTEIDMLPVEEDGYLVLRETLKESGGEVGAWRWPLSKSARGALTPEKLMDRFVDRWLTLRGQQGEK